MISSAQGGAPGTEERSRRKRIAATVGHLRSPDSGLAGQGLRFVIAGGTVSVIYVTTTTVLSQAAGLDFQIALAIGFSGGLVAHFTLQRLFVWSHHEEFALPLHAQLARYLTFAAGQYGATAAATAIIPRALHVSSEVVYLATVGSLVLVNFVFFRHGVFHAQEISEQH